MFGTKKNNLSNERRDSERSLISETVNIEGNLNSSGSIDVAGLVKGPVFSKEIVIKDTGSISGEIEADRVEIYGHLDGKVAAKSIVIGSTGVVKGDLLFSESLRTEEGAEIDGYIKKVSSIEKDESKIKELLFPSSENQEKKSKKTAKSQSVNKESEALA